MWVMQIVWVMSTNVSNVKNVTHLNMQQRVRREICIKDK